MSTEGASTNITRRGFLAGLGAMAAAGVFLEGVVFEPRRISVTMHRLGTPQGGGPPPLRIVQLTDLHLKSIGSFHEAIAERVTELDPQVIVLTGDAVDRADALPNLGAFLRLLPAGSRRYATLGNWEYWSRVGLTRLESTYGSSGCQLLVNETTEVFHRGRGVSLVGLDDLIAGQPDLIRAIGSTPLHPNVLLLSHCPEYRDDDAVIEMATATMLSGHTHGGQVVIGGWAPICPPGSGAYVSGWYSGSGPDLYVSRGLGTSAVPVRFGSVPEIACFDWHLDET